MSQISRGYRQLACVALLASLSGCVSQTEPEAPFPGEFANADYVISAENARQWAKASKATEQCIYPNLTRIQQAHFAKEDAYIHSQYVYFYPLEKIIGEEYVKIMQADEKSMGYATYLFKKSQPDEVEPLSAKQCQALREQAKADLAVVKGQYKSGMVEETKTDGKSPDGVATNENKFFFDIIKWGAALLI